MRTCQTYQLPVPLCARIGSVPPPPHSVPWVEFTSPIPPLHSYCYCSHSLPLPHLLPRFTPHTFMPSPPLTLHLYYCGHVDIVCQHVCMWRTANAIVGPSLPYHICTHYHLPHLGCVATHTDLTLFYHLYTCCYWVMDPFYLQFFHVLTCYWWFTFPTAAVGWLHTPAHLVLHTVHTHFTGTPTTYLPLPSLPYHLAPPVLPPFPSCFYLVLACLFCVVPLHIRLASHGY